MIGTVVTLSVAIYFLHISSEACLKNRNKYYEMGGVKVFFLLL